MLNNTSYCKIEQYLYLVNCYNVDMKICVTARFKSGENKDEIEALCSAVRAAGAKDFCFVRDVENYEKTFDNPQDLWLRARAEIEKCDALLIDVSDKPTGGRVIEAGIAYALHMPIIVIVKNGVDYKEIYDGIADLVVKYDTFKDVTPALKVLIMQHNS